MWRDSIGIGGHASRRMKGTGHPSHFRGPINLQGIQWSLILQDVVQDQYKAPPACLWCPIHRHPRHYCPFWHNNCPGRQNLLLVIWGFPSCSDGSVNTVQMEIRHKGNQDLRALTFVTQKLAMKLRLTLMNALVCKANSLLICQRWRNRGLRGQPTTSWSPAHCRMRGTQGSGQTLCWRWS